MRLKKIQIILKCLKSLTTIKPYLPEYKETLISIFKSNIPLYFAEEELPLFTAFLDRNDCPYAVILKDDVIVGCGGIALNEPSQYTTVPHVIMCWGMVHHEFHKQGLGKALLQYRIDQAKILYPDTRIALGTTQHSSPFFEKYGFKTVFYEKDHWAKDLDLYQMELL